MALIGPPCTSCIVIRIDVEDDPSHVTPVSPFRIGSKHPDIGDSVLFVVRSECRSVRGSVGAMRIKRRHRVFPDDERQLSITRLCVTAMANIQFKCARVARGEAAAHEFHNAISGSLIAPLRFGRLVAGGNPVFFIS